MSGDRIVRFITSFVASRDPAREEECDTFAEKLLRLLISLVTARDKSVRARCCQFVQVIFNSLKADELDEELLDSMQDTMLLRLGDKVPAVRVQAVQALPRLCEPGDVSPQVLQDASHKQPCRAKHIVFLLEQCGAQHMKSIVNHCCIVFSVITQLSRLAFS